MDYIEESLQKVRLLGLKSAQSHLDELMRYHRGELFVLNYLYFKNQKMTPTELSQALGSTPARISSILKVLEKKEEIVREIDVNNRNYIFVALTTKGYDRAKKVVAELDQTMSQVFQKMGQEDTIEFLRLANLFLDLFQQMSLDKGE